MKRKIRKKDLRYHDQGWLSFEGEVVIRLESRGGNSLSHASRGKNDDDLGGVIRLISGRSTSVSTALGILHYQEENPGNEKVFSVFHNFFSPSGGIPVRLDFDLRDLLSIENNGRVLPKDLIPVLKVPGERPMPNVPYQR